MSDRIGTRVHDLTPYADILGVNLYDAYPNSRLYPERTAPVLLGRAATTMLRAGEWPLGGRLGLEIWEQENFNLRDYYHGSYKSPHEIGRLLLPMQAVWFDKSGNAYNDGEPAVALADTYDLPIVRSLLSSEIPELEKCALVLSRRKDIYGTAHWFTSKDAVTKSGDGYVYVVHPKRALMKYDDPLLGVRDEYRSYDPQPYVAFVRTTKDDLPGSLLVIDAPDDEIGAFLDLVPESHPKEVSEALGIHVRPIGGVWSPRPLEGYPNLRVGR